jgi:hypothetical protein
VLTAGNRHSGELDALLVERAMPVVRQTVKRRFASARNISPEDVEDVCADALSAFLVRVRLHREGGAEILDFENYAAQVASHTADRFFAARSPQRARLRNRIRYVLTTDARFTLRESAAGVWLCGLPGGIAFGPKSALKLAEVVRQILSEAPGGKLDLSELTTLAAQATGVTDRCETLEDHAEFLGDPTVRFAHSAELKDRLAWLWKEVCELPAMQRVALLLNLGSGRGGNAWATMCTLADLGVATFAAVAAGLEMTQAELAAIWNRVPLEDKEIAQRLRVERQQVINLRASARQRLTRRMAVIDRSSTSPNAAGTNTEAYPGTRE